MQDNENKSVQHEDNPYAPIPEYIANEPLQTMSDSDEQARRAFEQQARQMNIENQKEKTKTLPVFLMGLLVGIIAMWLGFSAYLMLTGQGIGKLAEDGSLELSDTPYMNVSPVQGLVDTLEDAKNEAEEKGQSQETNTVPSDDVQEKSNVGEVSVFDTPPSSGVATSEQYKSPKPIQDGEQQRPM